MPAAPARVRKLLKKVLHLTVLEPNATEARKNEARAARHRADEIIREHGVTDAELRALLAEEKPVSRRGAGAAPDDPWQEALTLAVAKKYGCRALAARGKLFFEGEQAIAAASAHRRITEAVENAIANYREVRGRSPDPWATWTAILYAESASRSLQTRGIVDFVRHAVRDIDEDARSVQVLIDGATAVFALYGPYILVSATRPGSYASLFVGPEPGRKMVLRGDLSSFQNGDRMGTGIYTWVFERPGVPCRITFVCSDWEVVGELGEYDVRTTAIVARVARSPAGEPLYVERFE